MQELCESSPRENLSMAVSHSNTCVVFQYCALRHELGTNAKGDHLNHQYHSYASYMRRCWQICSQAVYKELVMLLRPTELFRWKRLAA